MAKKAEAVTPEMAVYDALQAAMDALQANRPAAGETYGREYAVTITELQKVFGYFNTFVVIPQRVEVK